MNSSNHRRLTDEKFQVGITDLLMFTLRVSNFLKGGNRKTFGSDLSIFDDIGEGNLNGIELR